MKVWDLLDMDVIPTWNKNRLVLIGDAAHPFLPCTLPSFRSTWSAIRT